MDWYFAPILLGLYFCSKGPGWSACVGGIDHHQQVIGKRPRGPRRTLGRQAAQHVPEAVGQCTRARHDRMRPLALCVSRSTASRKSVQVAAWLRCPMVRRRSTVRFRKGAQANRIIRTPRTSEGAIPGAKWSGYLAKSQSVRYGTSITGPKLPDQSGECFPFFPADPGDGRPITPLHMCSCIRAVRSRCLSPALHFVSW
jgi:hypothetical protein